MTIKLSELKSLVLQYLTSIGYSDFQSQYISEVIIDAELSGKKSHGLMRLPILKKKINEAEVKALDEDIAVIKETPVSFLFDGKGMTNFFVVPRSLAVAIEKVKKSGICAVGISNGAHASGMVGSYARKAAEQDLIFLGFTNSMPFVNPFGATEKLWGTNPVTVGITSSNIPIIYDSSTAKISVGDVLLAKQAGGKLPEDVALDEDGNTTTDPVKALVGGLLPIAGQKGSGLSFVVELIAGVLGKAKIGKTVNRGWGTFYILIDPTIFRDISEFKKEVDDAIIELKSARKAKDVNEIFFPGEKSQKLRHENLKKGEVEIDDTVYEALKS